MTMLSAPSASAIVTTTASAPQKALMSSKNNGSDGGFDGNVPASSKGSNNSSSALLELRSLALAASSDSADASAVDAVLERFTSLVSFRTLKRKEERKEAPMENKMELRSHRFVS